MSAWTCPIRSSMGLFAHPYGMVMFLNAVSPLKRKKINNRATFLACVQMAAVLQIRHQMTLVETKPPKACYCKAKEMSNFPISKPLLSTQIPIE